MRHQTSLQKQQGLSLMGFAMVAVLIIVFGIVAMKLLPVYQEYYSVVQAMEAVANQPGARQKSLSELRAMMQKRFDVGYVDSVKREHITLERDKGAFLRVKYEVRKPLVSNLDVVAHFDKRVELGG